ncbi:hypothetical protein LJC25_01170 [Bacteroidales bacterium OttesenSCG-928-K03]|nr:hypothetical protein [Odoribacter sp. OttesenSCG-928-L07]MDL2242322.1 hypothetical protein [Bacteroidales bacterium OttesenSCG-928-K03]
MAENDKNNKQIKAIIYVVLALLVVALIVMIVIFTSTKTKYSRLVGEKEMQRQELLIELDSLMVQHEEIKISYGELALQLDEKDSIINAEAKEIKRLLNFEWEYYKIRKKVTQLQEISKSYIVQMDSLYVVNADLVKENTQIKKDIQVERKKNIELTKEKEELSKKINIASAVKAFDINADSFHSTANRERKTDKAKRTNLIKVCFSIMENPLIENESINVYARIALPDGTIITDDLSDDYSFEYKGNVLQYTVKSTIQYSEETLSNICLQWTKLDISEPLPEGIYYINLFTEEFEIGQTYFELR